MIRPDFRKEFYHYGTKGKSGRYPLGSGERPYQDYPGMKKRRKPGRIALARLNAANTRKEAWEADKAYLERRKEASYEKYSTMSKKQIDRNERYFNSSIKFDNDNIERYSRKFEKRLQKFKDAGVNLDKKTVDKYDSIRYNELISFTGTKYYKKNKGR